MLECLTTACGNSHLDSQLSGVDTGCTRRKRFLHACQQDKLECDQSPVIFLVLPITVRFCGTPHLLSTFFFPRVLGSLYKCAAQPIVRRRSSTKPNRFCCMFHHPSTGVKEKRTQKPRANKHTAKSSHFPFVPFNSMPVRHRSET